MPILNHYNYTRLQEKFWYVEIYFKRYECTSSKILGYLYHFDGFSAMSLYMAMLPYLFILELNKNKYEIEKFHLKETEYGSYNIQRMLIISSLNVDIICIEQCYTKLSTTQSFKEGQVSFLYDFCMQNFDKSALICPLLWKYFSILYGFCI